MTDFKLKNVTWRLHQQRGRIHEDVDLWRKFVEQAHARQLHTEKKYLSSHIDRLQEGPRKLFLRLRLNKNQRASKE